MTRIHIPGVIAMAVIVVISNIAVQFLFGDWLTWGAFTYPFAFLVTDIMNRLYGPQAARRVVFAGFVTGVICSFIGSLVTIEVAPGVFAPAVTLRVALGSGTAFLIAQLLDVVIFHRLREGSWWRAPLVSTVISSAVDTAIFFTIAFAAALAFIEPQNDVAWANEVLPMLGVGPQAPLWMSLAVADYGVKLAIAVIALMPFRLIIARWAAARAVAAKTA